MPKIVRRGALNLTDDVVRIPDLGVPAPKIVLPGAAAPAGKAKPAKPAVQVETDGEGLPEIGDDFLEDEFEELPEPYVAEPEHQAAAVPDVAGLADALREEVIQGAMAEAGRIMEEAMRNAEQRQQELLAEVQGQAEQMRADAVEQGRHDGFDMLSTEVKRLTGELENAVARFEGERAGFEGEFEEQLKWLAIEIASKVLAHKVAEDDAVMVDMVDKAVQSVRNEPWVRVEVAQEMVRLIDGLTALYEGSAHISVSAIPADPGTVQIETPSGMVDASLRTQLDNLREYFAAAG